MTEKKYTRAKTAARLLSDLKAARPEMRYGLYGDWLGIATPGEVRRYWRSWMGRWPGWAGEPPQ